MYKFNNKILHKVKKHLNFTHSYVALSTISLGSPMYFIFFNDEEEQLEMHSDNSYEFIIRGRLNLNTIAAKIPYKQLDNSSEVTIMYDDKGNIITFRIGTFMSEFKFTKGNKKTSHTIAGQYKGLFTVKDGFEEYINLFN